MTLPQVPNLVSTVRVQINNISIDPSSGLVELPVALSDSSQEISSGCSSNSGSTFVATGRGGVPQNPNVNINEKQTWSDIRDYLHIVKEIIILLKLCKYRRNQQL